MRILGRTVVGLALGLGLACGPATPPTPADCPATECPTATVEVIVAPVIADGQAEHWCCAWDDGGIRRWAILDGPTTCQQQRGEQGGVWVEGPECIPCCCRTPLSETDASKGFSFELTSPVSCAGVGDCLPGTATECDQSNRPVPRESPRPRPDGTPPRGKKRSGN